MIPVCVFLLSCVRGNILGQLPGMKVLSREGLGVGALAELSHRSSVPQQQGRIAALPPSAGQRSEPAHWAPDTFI